MPTSTLRCRCGCKTRGRRAEMLITPSKAAFIDESHAASYTKERTLKLRRKKEKVERQEFKQRKREFQRNDYRRQFALTRKAAQRLGNLLDADKPCICCGRPRDGAVFCGGHYKTSGAHPELALSLINIHGQENVNCNMHLSGNISGTKGAKGFKAGLVERYGQEFVDYLESYRPTRKRTCEELIALRAEYSAEIRRLEKGLPPSRDWRSIQHQDHRLSGRGMAEQSSAA